VTEPVDAAGDGRTGDAARTLVVFDIDGVLADVGHRLHHLDGPRQNWSAFFAAAAGDPPLATGVALARELAAAHDLGYLTGRPEGLRAVTRGWLRRHDLPPGPLWMRPPGDYRPARVMKLDLLRRHGAEHSIEAVVDDDAEVVRALEAAGFAVLQATWAADSRRGGTLERAQEDQGRT
jgi:phosphoglycolate phosphatase-like HAD superfamily hydrolase